MENKDIVEALEKAPELVKAAETFKVTSGHIVSSLADAVKQRPQDEIPESELHKISQTPCAPPDVDSFSKALVQKVAGDIGSTIKEKVDEALEGATVKVQHTHSYCIERELKEVADIKYLRINLILWIIVVILGAIILISALTYYTGKTYWGKQFYEVYSSSYLTSKERDTLKQDFNFISVLPCEFDKDPKRVKEHIKQVKATLKERKREAKKSSTR